MANLYWKYVELQNIKIDIRIIGSNLKRETSVSKGKRVGKCGFKHKKVRMIAYVIQQSARNNKNNYKS